MKIRYLLILKMLGTRVYVDLITPPPPNDRTALNVPVHKERYTHQGVISHAERPLLDLHRQNSAASPLLPRHYVSPEGLPKPTNLNLWTFWLEIDSKPPTEGLWLTWDLAAVLPEVVAGAGDKADAVGPALDGVAPHALLDGIVLQLPHQLLLQCEFEVVRVGLLPRREAHLRLQLEPGSAAFP